MSDSRRNAESPILARSLLTPLILWGLLALAVCVHPFFRHGRHSVHPQFRAASHHWWADQSLYASYWATEHIDGFRYSPTFAVAYTPLAYLPRHYGAIVFGLGSIGLLLFALHVMVRQLLPGTAVSLERTAAEGRSEGPFLALALAGSVAGIWSGQSNAVVTALLILGLAAVLRQRWWAAAFLLAIPVFIKLWPVALVLLLLVFWPRQLIGRFLAACALFAMVPFLTRPPATVAWQYAEWYRALTGPLQGRWLGYRDAWTIWEALGPVPAGAYKMLQLATALGVFAWCLWQWRRRRAANRFLMCLFSIWAAWQLLWGPGTEQLTYGLIAPSVSWAVLVSYREKRARWLTTAAWAMTALLASGDFEKAVCRVVGPHGTVLLPLGVALFLVWLLWHESIGSDRLSRQAAVSGG